MLSPLFFNNLKSRYFYLSTSFTLKEYFIKDNNKSLMLYVLDLSVEKLEMDPGILGLSLY